MPEWPGVGCCGGMIFGNEFSGAVSAKEFSRGNVGEGRVLVCLCDLSGGECSECADDLVFGENFLLTYGLGNSCKYVVGEEGCNLVSGTPGECHGVAERSIGIGCNFRVFVRRHGEYLVAEDENRLCLSVDVCSERFENIQQPFLRIEVNHFGIWVEVGKEWLHFALEDGPPSVVSNLDVAGVG